MTPSPTPSCVQATVFADCFSVCTGTISGVSPGPICGWTFIEPFGALGGEFNFTPGIMLARTFDADDFPIASKPLPAPLATVMGLSGQFTFTEYATPPNGDTTYQVILNNADGSESLLVSLFGDGIVAVQAGDPASIPTYSGTWAPNGGAHTVHFLVDGAGVPTLFVDAAPIALTFTGNVPSFATLYPANSIAYGGGSGDVTPASSPLRSLFLTAGLLGSGTDFCCP